MTRYVSSIIVLVLFFSQFHAQEAKTGEAKNLPSSAGLRGLLGKNHLDIAFKPIRGAFAHHPYALYFESGREFYHEWPDEGISMLFQNDVLAAVFLYNEKVENNHRWAGELPEKLDFTDDVDGVENKLGKPETVVGGNGHGAMTYSYPVKGIVIRFQTWDRSERRAKIRSVTLQVPWKSGGTEKGTDMER
jgi:hypothetical protein